LPSKSAQLRRLITLRAEALAALDSIEQATARLIIEEVVRATTAIVGMVEANINADSLILSVEKVLSRALSRVDTYMLGAFTATADLSLMTTLRQIDSFRTIPPNVIEELALNFNTELRGELMNEARENWIRALSDHALRPASGLREALAEAVVQGVSIKRAAETFLRHEGLADLPATTRRINDAARATAVVRTELTNIDAAVSIRFAEAAGITRFINLGVGDERQSEICGEATRQPPMTRLEWIASKYGLPARHVNCRCSCAPVPEGIDDTLSDPALESAGVLSG
jgi:hypothetical protein